MQHTAMLKTWKRAILEDVETTDCLFKGMYQRTQLSRSVQLGNWNWAASTKG